MTGIVQSEPKHEPIKGPWRITFDTNPDDCNMYCIMCEEHSEYSLLREKRIKSGRPHRRMDIEVVRKTVEEMVPFGLKEIIPSTMGEPLLYGHFLEILEICRTNKVKLNLTTNGTWPGLGPEKWAELICPVTKDVKISWNGASKGVQESIMKGSSFDKRLSDLRKFITVRDRIASEGGNLCRITLQATFLELNLEELPSVVEMAIQLGIDRVKGHQLWVHFEAVRDLDMRRSEDSIRRWNSIVDKCCEIADRKRKSNGQRVVLDNFNRLDLSSPGSMPDDWICPFLGNEAWVNHEGRFDPCCAPDAERRKLGYFGNVMTQGGMKGIWSGAKYTELKEHHMSSSVCRKCTMRRPVEEVRML